VSRLLLGVDGGATKTVALVADSAGTVLGAGRAGSSDIHSESPPRRALDNVVSSVHEALRDAGARAAEVEVCVFGLCGADWDEDVAYYVAGISERIELGASPFVTNDAFNSLRAGTDAGVGVALVMGTGGAIAARGLDGATWFSGERMERAGASELGRLVYDGLVRAEYGEGPRPAYEPAALRIFGVESVEALVHAITRTGGTGYRSVSRLAPAMLEAAHVGDPESERVVSAHGRRMSEYIRAAGRRVGLGADGRRVVLAGGLLRSPGSHLRDAIVAELLDWSVSVARLEPAFGAVLLAADHAGVGISVERLAETGPDRAFFDTTTPS
jgi:N-acetylglucosamine kinase-like BadF-type ATPase